MFPKLFEPLKIGPTTIKNRIQVLPHNTLFDFEMLISYCEARARGGAGLIEVSLATPTRDLGELPQGPLDAWPYKGYDPKIVPLYQKMAKAIHGYGAKVFFQLAAAGGNRSAKRGVSPVPGGIQRLTPRELDEGEIKGIVEDHAIAAKYMLDGGIDGVDLHGTHGMLLEEFLSKATNRRTDRYGGSLDNRLRLVREIISRIQESTKGELAVGMRLDADDKFPEGNDLEEEVRLAGRLDGALDFLNVDIGFEHQYTYLSIAPFYEEPGFQLYAARAIKQAVRKTVVGATGRIVDPVMAEQVLREGTADIVGMTRALIADPDLPNKVLQGKLEDIRFCLGDNQRCIGNMLRGLPIRCTVNPLIGREGDPVARNLRAGETKTVLVMGGGLAGMEVARACAERGHAVHLFEKNDELGGQVRLAARLPGRSDLLSIVKWYEGQLKKLGVDVRMHSEVGLDSEFIEAILADLRPDCVVVATGSTAIKDGTQSLNYQKIRGHEFAITLDDALSGAASVGRRVVILDEPAFVEGLSLAEKLGKAGSEVELVTRDIAPGMELQWSLQIPYVYERVLKVGVTLTPNTFVEEIGKNSVLLYNIYSGKKMLREKIDTTILNTGRLPCDELVHAFSRSGLRVETVGDCNLAGRQMGDAITEAYNLALTV